MKGEIIFHTKVLLKRSFENLLKSSSTPNFKCIDEDDDEDIEDDKLWNHKLCEDDDGNGNPYEDDDGNGNPCEDDDGNGNPCEDDDRNGNPCEDDDGNGNPCEDDDGNGNLCKDDDRNGNPCGDEKKIPIDLRIQVVALIIVNECQHVGPSYYNLEPPDDFNIEPAVAMLNAQIAGAYTNSQVPRNQLIVGLRTFADAKARACSLEAAKAVLIDDGLSKALLAKHTQYDRKLHVEMLKMGTKQKPSTADFGRSMLAIPRRLVGKTEAGENHGTRDSIGIGLGRVQGVIECDRTNIHTEVDSHEEEVGVMDLDKEGVLHAMMDVDDAIQQNDVLDFNEHPPQAIQTFWMAFVRTRLWKLCATQLDYLWM
ncbi:hypothetical protein HDU88_002413 [Geranomyces variabilis]|nr:hypothetical protein HDU88_002413 [Geranomyces variabilis]